jgi:hypothetical protein
LYDIISVRILWHACCIEKYGGVVQMPFLACICIFARAKNMNNTCM